jgi:hypothetical protein
VFFCGFPDGPYAVASYFVASAEVPVTDFGIPENINLARGIDISEGLLVDAHYLSRSSRARL